MPAFQVLPRSSDWLQSRGWGEACSFPPNTVLFEQGSHPVSVHLVEAGVVRLMRRHEQRDVLVGVRNAGWLLGSTAAVLSVRHGATASTLTRCELRTLHSATLRQLLRTDPSVSQWLLELLATETYDQMTRLAELLGSQGRARVERLLVDLFSVAHDVRADGALRLTVGVSVQELADVVCLTREQAGRILANLASDGVVVRHKGRLQLPADSPLRDRVTLRAQTIK
jgi:CRP-like cAMP-binding protein